MGSEVTLNCSSDEMGSFVLSNFSINDLSSAASVAISLDTSGVFSVRHYLSPHLLCWDVFLRGSSCWTVSSTIYTDLRVQCEFMFKSIW